MNDITRNAIAATLKQLLGKKPLSRITVSDIAAECGISRMTFYYHFHDIFDLVGWIISSDISRILSGRKTYDTWQAGFLSIFHAVEEDRVLVINACSSMSREQLERILRGPVTELIRSVLMENPISSKLSDDECTFVSAFYSYAFIGIMLDWISDGLREKPEMLMKRIECVMEGALENAARRFAALQIHGRVRNADSSRDL